MATTYENPFSWEAAEASGELAQSYYIEAMQAYLRLAETMNPLEWGLLTMQGMIGGAGSDTLRVPDQTNLAGVRPALLTTETQRPSYQAHALGYTDFSVACYGLARSMTYDGMIYNHPAQVDALSIENFLGQVPNMSAALLRYLAAQAVAGISSSVGSSAAKTSYDTLIAFAAAFNANGYQPMVPGNPIAALHPVQWSHIQESVRIEPGFQANGLATNAQGLVNSPYLPDPLSLGVDIALMSDITTSGGAYQGGGYDRGGIGIAFADVNRIRVPKGVQDLRLPNLGVVMQEPNDGAGERTREAQYYQWVGVAKGSSLVFRQSRILGQT